MYSPNANIGVVERAVGRIQAYNAFVSRADELGLLVSIQAKSILDVSILDRTNKAPAHVRLIIIGPRSCSHSQRRSSRSMDD